MINILLFISWYNHDYIRLDDHCLTVREKVDDVDRMIANNNVYFFICMKTQMPFIFFYDCTLYKSFVMCMLYLYAHLIWNKWNILLTHYTGKIKMN